MRKIGRSIGVLAGVLSVFASIAFFDASAAWAEPAVIVDPSAGLLDGESVTVSATGFTPNAYIGAAQCDASRPGEGIDACDISRTVLEPADESGAVTATLSIRRHITTPAGGQIDCITPGACVIGAASLGDDLITPDLATVVIVPITLDPNPAPPTPLDTNLVVDVTTGLVDGQLLAVRATGFVPDGPFGITMCDEAQLDVSYDVAACDLTVVLLASIDSTGSSDLTYGVRRYITRADGTVVDCAEAERCVLAAASLTDNYDLNPAATEFLALSFDPSVPGELPQDRSAIDYEAQLASAPDQGGAKALAETGGRAETGARIGVAVLMIGLCATLSSKALTQP